MPLKIMQEESDCPQPSSPAPWYANGLRFKCTECGQCCSGSPGYVWITPEEIEKIAQYLKIPVDRFYRSYIRRVHGRLSLVEHSKTYDCVFLENKKCRIYPVRPTQCRTFPWWPQQLKSEKEWEEAAKYCEGIHPDAPIVPATTIQEQLAIQEKIN